MEKTAVVILNYNGETYLRKFLPGVIQYSHDCSIYLADNCSTDNSLQFVTRQHPEVKILMLPENKGYSEGYNQALRQIDATYYVLLNSDVEVTDRWLDPVIDMLDNDPQIAAAQSKILSFQQPSHFEYAGAAGGYVDILGYPFCRGRLFNTLEKDVGQYDDIHQIFWATGACMFIRSEVFHSLGGLDPDFFAHMEEIDLCWRINNAGFKVMYNGHSTVYHVGGGTLDKSNPRKTYLNFRNGLALIYKNYDTTELLFKFPLRVILDIIASLKFALFDSLADGWAVIRAHWDFMKDLPTNYRKRKDTQRRKKRNNLPAIYKGSIVWEYFLKNRRSFGKLKMRR